MRIVVTGANGLIGSRLARLLSSRGHDVIAWGRGPQRATLNAAKYQSLELTDARAVSSAVSAAFPQVIINPAAMTDVDGCERDPLGAWDINVGAVATLARAARLSASFLLHVSTDYVFDGDAGPYQVDATPNPRGAYALTKHAGEQAVRALLPADAWAIARTAVVYGWPAEGKSNFGSWLISSLSEGKKVSLFADQRVSTTHADNAAAMLAELAERKLPGLWHVAGAEVTDRVEFGQRLCARFGFDASLITPARMVDVRLASPRPARSGLQVDRTTNTLKAAPWTLAEGLEALLAEYRKGRP